MKTNTIGLFVLSVVFLVTVGSAGMRAAPTGETGKATAPAAASLSDEDKAALELGRGVLAIQRVLKNPTAPDAMNVVTHLGHDSRYYVMIRGWLTYQLSGDQSIINASRGNPPKLIADRAAFLQKAIRYLDLE
jgi:hypothetical protein